MIRWFLNLFWRRGRIHWLEDGKWYSEKLSPEARCRFEYNEYKWDN